MFARLRAILEKHQPPDSTLSSDTSDRYCLEGVVGPATLRAWGGKARRAHIPVAWVESGKSYVSFHLMAVDPALRGAMSPDLEKRMQGKTCFHFTIVDEPLFAELERVTAQGLTGFRKAGFVSSDSLSPAYAHSTVIPSRWRHTPFHWQPKWSRRRLRSKTPETKACVRW